MKLRPLLLLLGCALLAAADTTTVNRPNIILILSDDQDWNGLSVRMHPDIAESRSDYFETPNLEKFASQSMRFSNGYAPAPVCSPTRISLQTGMTPARLGWTKAAPAETGYRLIEGDNRKAIRDEEVTFAELLRKSGYATAHFGKWHLSGGGPEKHGYDVSDGDTGNREAEAFKDPNPVDIFGMTDRAKAFMETNQRAGKPFYLQMSYNALHVPENANRSSLAKFEAKAPGKLHRDPARAAIAYDLDTGVGKLLASVAALGLDKNTYVIYMADNGGGGGGGGKGGKGASQGLRGGKGGLWEGGIRVPCLMSWPSVLPKRKKSAQAGITMDLTATFLKAAGGNLPEDRPFDGINLIPHLNGEKPIVQRTFYWRLDRTNRKMKAIRHGKYKYLDDGGTMDLLIDLEADPGERVNLHYLHPDISADLKAKLKAWEAEMDASDYDMQVR